MRLDTRSRQPAPEMHDGRSGEGRGEDDRARRRRSRAWLARAAAVAAIVGAGAWAYVSNTGSRPAMDMGARVVGSGAAFPVTLVSAARTAIAGVVTYTGTVAPFNEEDVYPRVTGRIVEMPVYPGDAVRAGQVIARLDEAELSSRLHEARAMLATAAANRAQMEAEVAAAAHGIGQMEQELAMVEAELVYARGVLTRSDRLVAAGAISRQEHESDRAMTAALEARRQAALAKLAQARAMEVSARRKLEAAEAMVAQAGAAARTAEVVRDYVTITAPGPGYVVKRLVAPGVLVQPGMAIMKIAQIDRVRLQANVGEKDLASLRVGSRVTVTTVGGGSPRSARVTSVFPFVDPGGRTAIVEAIVDNADRRLVPGQFVTMQFATGERADAVTVPSSAVARLGGRSTVWVVTDDRAEPRAVETGLESVDRIEIRRGIMPGERVVVRGHDGLYAGARVTEAGRVERAVGGEGGPPDRSAPAGSAGMPPAGKEGGHAGH